MTENKEDTEKKAKDLESQDKSDANEQQASVWSSSTYSILLEFLKCFLGLQISYILWGMMQELIMSKTFSPTPRNPSGKFPSATFCVFSNRFLAIVVGMTACYLKHGKVTSVAPLLAFTPCALSNTISSWSQYQALAYVSFSLQTIFKSIKVLPVMIMGVALKGTMYSLVEYMEATLISIGVLIFSLSKSNWVIAKPEYEVLGTMLLGLYVLSDSFTSQWQSRIYKDYPNKLDHYQMMYGVNVSSIVFTLIALVTSNELPLVFEFFYYNPECLLYNVITAITSATGQIAIYYTIKTFGPVTFTIIMTTRQMLSIAISNYMFHHSMPLQCYMGAAMVFATVIYSALRQMKGKSPKLENKQEQPTVNKS